MKKKNIAFTGAMAAILFSAGANAATATKIASQKYVDDKETSILQTVSNTYATTETVDGISTNITNITEQITNLGDTVNDAENGVVAKADKAIADAAAAKTAADKAQGEVDALETVVGNETAGLVKTVADAAAAAAAADTKATNAGTAAKAAQDDVDALETVVAGKAAQSDLTALTTRVGTAEGEIDALQTTVGTGTLTTTAQTIVAAVNELKTKTDGMATEGTITEMGNKITGLETAVEGKADKATTLAGYGITDAYTKTETTTQIQNYAIPKPSESCKAASGTCVLSVNTSGALEWVDVTAPLQ